MFSRKDYIVSKLNENKKVVQKMNNWLRSRAYGFRFNNVCSRNKVYL